jgi:hypothetical protein
MRAVPLLLVEDRPLQDQFIGQPPLEQLGGKVIPTRAAQRTNGAKVLIGHGFHLGRGIPAALFAADYVIPGPSSGAWNIKTV